MELKKVCRKCKKEKLLTDFHQKTESKDGRGTMCKNCYIPYRRNIYLKNYKYERKRNNDRKKYLLDLVIKIKIEEGCVDCGIKDSRILDFDHVDKNNKIASVCKLVNSGTSEQKILDEIKKCEVRCANCHRIKTAIDFNYRSNDIKWQKYKEG